jgi:hypothetical protein
MFFLAVAKMAIESPFWMLGGIFIGIEALMLLYYKTKISNSSLQKTRLRFLKEL